METKFMIYGVGGTAVNLLQEHIRLPQTPAWSKMEVVRIDMSDANIDLDSELPAYLIPGVKGNGKNRLLGHGHAQPHVEPILTKHKPGTLNIVMYGGAGASGSTLGPLLAKELTARGLPTVVFIVGSVASGKETDNTYKSLLTLQQIVNDTKRPLAMAYYENATVKDERFSRRGLRSEIDDLIRRDIATLALLTSEQHLELDREDATNFLNYPAVVPNMPPQLTEMVIAHNSVNWEAYNGAVISTMSLMVNKDNAAPALGQPYSCDGFYRDEVVEEHGEELHEVTAALTALHINEYITSLKEKNANFTDVASVLSRNTGIDMSEVDSGDFIM